MFKIGDRVKLIKEGAIEWEQFPYYVEDNMEINGVYIVSSVTKYSVYFCNHSYWHHPDHFELVGRQKKYKVSLSQDDLDSIVLISSNINGSYYNSSSSVFDDISNNTDVSNNSVFKTDIDISYPSVLNRYLERHIVFIKKVY